MNHCKDKFKQFLKTFVNADLDSDERMEGVDLDQPIYMQKLEEVGHWKLKFKLKSSAQISCRHSELPTIFCLSILLERKNSRMLYFSATPVDNTTKINNWCCFSGTKYDHR